MDIYNYTIYFKTHKEEFISLVPVRIGEQILIEDDIFEIVNIQYKTLSNIHGQIIVKERLLFIQHVDNKS